MSNVELLRLATQKQTLTDAAQQALDTELNRRQLNTATVKDYQQREERQDNLDSRTEQAESLRRRRVRLAHFYRLALFICTALLSALVIGFLFRLSGKAEEKITVISLDLAVALSALTFVFSGKWLTFRRSVYIAVLFSLGLFMMVWITTIK